MDRLVELEQHDLFIDGKHVLATGGAYWTDLDPATARAIRVVTGGARVGDRGYVVEPAAFANVDHDMRISQEEIFGPVLSVRREGRHGVDQHLRLHRRSMIARCFRLAVVREWAVLWDYTNRRRPRIAG